jgi:hypothetical protein
MDRAYLTLRLRSVDACGFLPAGLVSRAPTCVKDAPMPKNIPDEVVVAKLSIEAATIALESLFEKMKAVPRAEKMLVNETVREACARLKAAQELLAQLDTALAKPD